MARIDVVGPDGKDYTLDVAEWSKAKGQGFKLKNETSQLESGVRGAVQGATLGWSDELLGHAKALAQAPADWLYEKMHPEDPTKTQSYGQLYDEGRDAERVKNANAKASNPGTYGISEFAGTLPLAIAAPATLPAAIASGALMGAGGSEATDAGQLARDTGIGAGFGLGGYAAGKALSFAGGRLVDKASGMAASGRAKAAELATKSQTAPVKALEGTYGGLRQTENKAILALLGLEEKGLISPENAAKLAQLRQTGRLGQALNEAAANDLEFLGSRIGQVAGAKAEAQAARAALPQNIADETARLGSSGELKNQIMARVKRYGWPMLGSAVGSVVGGPVGAAVGALGGAGMRPAMRSWMNLARTPVGQMRLGAAGEAVGHGIENFGPAAATATGLALAVPHNPVPSPKELASRDPVVGAAYQKGGNLAAASTFYNEAQRRPEQILSFLQDPEP